MFCDDKVGKMVHSMKMGWMKTPAEREKEIGERSKEGTMCYDLWSHEDEVRLYFLFYSFYSSEMVQFNRLLGY